MEFRHSHCHTIIVTFIFQLAFTIVSITALAQTNAWEVLADVSYQTKKDKSGKYDIQYPIFGSRVKQLAGREIELKGFIVPLDEMLGHKYFVLSSLPFNMCFFCGGAGPETVIEVFSKKEIPFTDEIIVVKGIFELNDSDPEKLMYLLKDAQITQ